MKFRTLFFLIILISILRLETFPQNGIIKGKVTIEESVSISKRQRTTYKHEHGSSSKIKENEVENVVIYIEEVGKKGNYSYSGKNPVLTQKDASFIPKVLPILKGTTVDIKNEDKIYHNVFSLSDPKPFNIGRRPEGETVPQTFNKSGLIRVFCDIHPNMSAFIVVLDNPYYVKVNSKGEYTLTNLPPGKYIVHAWHYNSDADPVEITIGANETKTIDFSLK